MSTDDQMNPRGVQRNRPDHVDVLASTVISVLHSRQATSVEGLRQIALDHLVRAVLSRGSFDASDLLDALRGYRLYLDSLIDFYVPAAARVLGEQWVDDTISFAEVTIGTLRLQSLLEEASSANLVDLQFEQDRLNTLIVVPSGEQHFLGASVVSAQLRRIGCEVGMSFDESCDTLAARLMQDSPDLVLITCSRADALEQVEKVVQTIRNTLSDSAVIAVGGAFDTDRVEVKKITGADIVTSVASEAASYCTKRLRSKKLL